MSTALFPRELRCGNCGNTDDHRELRGVVEVPAVIAPPSARSGRLGDGGSAGAPILGIADLEERGQSFLHCVSCGNPIKLGPVPGVFYHPARERWIVWGDEIFPQRSVDSGVVRDGEFPLGLRLPADRVLALNPKDLLLGKVVRFHYRDENLNRIGTLCAALPVRPVYADLIDLSRLPPQPSDKDGGLRYGLPLLGCAQPYEAHYVAENIVAVLDSYLEVWPHLPGWRTYWVLHSLGQEGALELVTEEWSIDCYSAEAQGGAAGRLQPHPMLSDRPPVTDCQVVTAWPDLVYFRSRLDPDTGGAVYLPRPAAPRGIDQALLRPGQVSLDFGTSRTAVMVATRRDVERWFSVSAQGRGFSQQPGVPGFARSGKVVLPGMLQHRQAAGLGPTTSHPRYPASDSEVDGPRMCLVRSLVVRNGEQGAAEGEVPFRDYVVPPRAMDSMPSYSLANKWELERGPLVAFLHSLLLVAGAEFHLRYPGARPHFSFSYPLAFSAEERQSFIHLLSLALRAANRSLPVAGPFTCTLDPTEHPIPYPESMAAYTAAMATGGRDRSKAVIVADLGGGTLDLGMWRIPKVAPPDGKSAGELPAHPILSDSVELGADRILDILCQALGYTAKLDRNKLDRDKLSWIIMDEGYRGIRATYGAHKDWDEIFLKPVRRWLDLLVEYIARGIGGSLWEPVPRQREPADRGAMQLNATTWAGTGELPEELILVLVGAGWKVVEAMHWGPEHLEKEVRERLVQRLEGLGFRSLPARLRVHLALLQRGLEKAAVAGGLQTLSQDGPPLIEGVQAPNGLDEGLGGTVLWTTPVGPGAPPWRGGTIAVKDGRNVSPPVSCSDGAQVTDMTIDANLRAEIEGQLAKEQAAHGGHRMHSALSLFMKQVAVHNLRPAAGKKG